MSRILSTGPGQVPPPRQVQPWAGTPLGRYTRQGRYTPLDRYTPWAGTPPRYTPLAGTSPRQVHPPPQQVHPARQVYPQAGAPPQPQCMLGCGQQAGGTHPTGMHSFYVLWLLDTSLNGKVILNTFSQNFEGFDLFLLLIVKSDYHISLLDCCYGTHCLICC